jgi:alkaline phosphatase/streptomycin-6-phosphatase
MGDWLQDQQRPHRVGGGHRRRGEALHDDSRAGAARGVQDRQREQCRDRFEHRGRHGCFLQVEGASIDKQDHVEAPCQQIGETIAFDRAIKVGLDSPNTIPTR